MPLSIVNWNILFDAKRPRLEVSRFPDGKPSLEEQKAASAALAFFCYDDNVSPSDPHDPVKPSARQLVKQRIKGQEYPYYRGGSNVEVRMKQVKENIQTLAQRADVVCLQEVTEKMAKKIEKTCKATHQVFYSFLQGNNHGVMVLVKKELEVVANHEVKIENGGLARKVRVIDIRDQQSNAVVRVAAAHLYGHHDPAQPIDEEIKGLFAELKKLPGKVDATVVGADVNETKRARESGFKQLICCEAKSTEAAGWQLHLVGRTPQTTPIPVQAKPAPFALCAILLDKQLPSEPMDLSGLPEGLSDHAPIGTKITFPAAAHPKPEPAEIEKPAKVDPAAKIEKAAKIGKPAKADLAAKVEKPAKADLTAKVEKPAKSETPAKIDAPAAKPPTPQAAKPQVAPPPAAQSLFQRFTSFCWNILTQISTPFFAAWQWFVSWFR